MSTANLEEIRSGALGRIENDRKNVTRLIAVAAAVEAVFLGAFLWLMDFHNKEHWLLLCAAGLIYGTLGVGLLTLGVQQNTTAQRVLKALELVSANGERKEEAK